ncbi:MAG: restriction endonuclease subunit S [Acinetobacter towneri]
MTAPKLRFKEFKNDWLKTNLGEVVKFSNGKRVPLSESERQKRQGAYRYYGASGVIDYVDDYLFDGEYILIGEDGANIITRSSTLAFVVTGKFWVNNHAHIFQSKEGNNIFLATYLESLNFEKFNSGTAQPKLNLENLKKVPVANPTKEEQTKIATFLSAVDEKISQLSQKLQLLGQYKQGMMHKLFSQQIRFKADDGSEFEEWEERKLSEISQKAMYGMNAAATEYDGINKYLRITDICEFSNSFKMDNLTSPNAELDDKYKLQLGDLLFARTGASVGKSYLYKENDGITYFAGFLIKFSLNTNLVIPYFIFLQTLTKGFSQWVVTNSMRSGQPGINAEEYSSYIFKVPCLAEQTKIANFLSSIDQKIDVVSEQLEQAKLWKKGLLQQMFV